MRAGDTGALRSDRVSVTLGVQHPLLLVQDPNVPFRMFVSEQFDRLVPPTENRFSRQDIEAWLCSVGFEVVAILPGLGWRAIGRRPTGGEIPDAAR